MNYDPDIRRATPLALKLKQRIRRDGPISVHDYMTSCLQDDEHGYYRTRAAIGRGGDFITAPEISQIFGELLGLWALVVWQQMGSPGKLRLVELGPGRGSLLRDALRATSRDRAFAAATEVILVETSAPLAAEQQRALAGVPFSVRWVTALSDLSPGQATIILANEFLDTFPVHQYVHSNRHLVLRQVSLDAEDRLVFSTGAGPVPPPPRLAPLLGGLPDGAIVEYCDWGTRLAPVAALMSAGPSAALLIDYGHSTSAAGDTLQALRAHTYEHPLTSPGEADLTAHVDFAAVSASLRPTCQVSGPVTQGEFLGSLGIAERASRLMSANPHHAASLEAGVLRLMSPTGMGSRFKALGIASRGLPPLPGLPVLDSSGETRLQCH